MPYNNRSKKKPTKAKSPKAKSAKNPTARVYLKKNSMVKGELNFTRLTGRKKTKLT